MEVKWEHCAGIDLGKKTLAVCLLNGRAKEIRTYGTTTVELLALRDWLKGAGCQAVAMEATGSFWKPVWNVLEDQGMELALANPQRIKAIPGRKSDVRDSEWIADLMRYGLIAPSYVPNRDQRELREMTRYRTSLVGDRAREVNRLEKVLEGANIKLGTVLTDITGKSGIAILRAIAAGVEDPDGLSQLTVGPVKASREQFSRALTGYVNSHQRYMISLILDGIESFNQRIAQLDAEIADRMKAFQPQMDKLKTIPGIADRSAQVVIAEVGPDVSHFATAAHLSSWSGLAPGQNESAGKRKSSRIPPGERHLRSVLVQCAWAAVRSRGTYFSAQFWHLQHHLGKKRAIVAVAHSMITSIYHILQDGTEYQELGPTHFDRLNREAIVRRAIRQLERSGYAVSLTPVAAA
jgi:transposase